MKARLCFQQLLPKILRSSSQLWEIQSGSWPREVLHGAKTKTIKRWVLNTSDIFMNLRAENFFVGHIYTMQIKYNKKYIHEDMYNAFDL